ncbi:hypothetical protein AAC387_Pa08g2484 [Persea americana]
MEEGIEKRRITTTEDLSNDLTVEILLLLPLTSVIQCFNVCKRWRSLITGCPSLLNYTVNVAWIQHDSFRRYTCLEEGQRRMQSSELDFFLDSPMQSQRQRVPPASSYLNHLSCNGLLFSYFLSRLRADLNQCYISNPLTKECVRLPNPNMGCHDSLCGLAFENNPRIINSSCNNRAFFKIVMAHSINLDREKASYQFEIYSSDKSGWQLLKTASKPHDPSSIKPDQNAVYVNRVLYWLCPGISKALMFNLVTETSDYLELPTHYDETYCKLTVCDGHLHYIRRHYDRYRGRDRLSLLKMSKNGDWLILDHVDLQGAMERYWDLFPMRERNFYYPIFRPIDMSCQGDDKVLLSDSYRRIVSYDLKWDVFEIVLEKDNIQMHKLFRYTPTNKR